MVLRAAGELQGRTIYLYAFFAATAHDASQHVSRVTLFEEFEKACSKFTRAGGVASIVVNREVANYIDQLALIARQVADAAIQDEPLAKEKSDEFARTLVKLQRAVRADLGIDSPK